MESIWKYNVKLPHKNVLPKNMEVNTLVIGAGIAGLLTAYFLQKKGVEVIVVEAKTIASGQTGNTTAKITSQHDLCYEKMIRKAGRKRAKAYAMANEEAIFLYKQIVEEENIDCDFCEKPAYLYTTSENNIEILQKETEAAKSLGIKAKYVEGKNLDELPFEVCGAVCFENQAQFHPLKFVRHLAEKLVVYENTKVLSVSGHKIRTNKGTIIAENIVFATHYPITNVPGFYFLRQHQERSYVVALQNDKELNGMYYSMDEDGLSLRSEKDILLLGGGAHRTGKCLCHNGEKGQSKYGYEFLRNIKERYFSEKKEISAWSAQDCMPHDEMAFIGKYSIFRPYWYVATGFKKWGMTQAMVSAMILSSKICEERSIYEKTFSPQRFLLWAGIKNFLVDLWESVKGLVTGVFARKDRRCAHMGCKLHWNAEEESFDCACHGSRFSKRGEIIDNPAQMDLNGKK